MDWQNLGYALVQVAHNFGAASVVGAPLFALWPAREAAGPQRSLAWLALAGWIVQALTGAGFGAVSFYWYGQFPDIHGVAIAALVVKIACAIAGFVLAVGYLFAARAWSESRRRSTWGVLFAFGAIALTAAAFLRWFS
ncbi:MAG: hypothetical protein ACLGHY_05105 [Gammaproteobacteria bacterium]